MNPIDIFDKSDRLSYQTSKEHDVWASAQIQIATRRLLKHYEKSKATFKDFETYIFNGTSGCYKKLSYKTELKWRDEVAVFELSCPTKESASGLFMNSLDVRIYTNDPLTGRMIYTSINRALTFPNKVLLFKFLGRNFGWFTDSFFNQNDVANYSISVQINGKDGMTKGQKEEIGKYIAIEKLSSLWVSAHQNPL